MNSGDEFGAEVVLAMTEIVLDLGMWSCCEAEYNADEDVLLPLKVTSVDAAGLHLVGLLIAKVPAVTMPLVV